MINIRTPAHDFINESSIVATLYGYAQLNIESPQGSSAKTNSHTTSHGSPPSRRTIEAVDDEESSNKQTIILQSQVLWSHNQD